MAFLTIASITVHVGITGATENAPDAVVGSDSRAYDGSLRTTVRDEKRSWQFTTKPTLQADYETLRDAVKDGQHVTIGGDAVTGGATARVTITSAPYVKTRGSFRRIITLVVKEV